MASSFNLTPSRRPLQESRNDDIWLDDDIPNPGPPSPTKSNLMTPKKPHAISELHAQVLNTPSSRTSRSQGLNNVTPKKSFARIDPHGQTVETFEIGSQVIISPFAATSAYVWLHKKKQRKRKIAVEPWTHLDSLEENEKVGIITELFEDEIGEKRVKVRWFARPGMLWSDGGPSDGTPEDYEPWELCYVHDSDWCAAKQLLDEFIRLGVKLTTDSLSNAEYAECSKAIRRSHAVDVILLSDISERIEVVPWKDWPNTTEQSSQPISKQGHRMFRCRRIYDSRPLAWDIGGFIKDVNFEEVLKKGLSKGLWDIYVERENPNILDMEAEERRRLERRRIIKENNQKQRQAPAQSSSAPARKRLRECESDDECEEDDDRDLDYDIAEDDMELLDDEVSEEEHPNDDESDDGSTPVKNRPKHKVGRPKKALPKAKMTAAQRAKHANLLERRKARVASRLANRKDVLRMPTVYRQPNLTSTTDPWARARQILHVSSTPEWLPCREEEFAELEAALEDSIDESSGCCMYISGVPGTGKTATVHSVIRTLQAKVDRGELHKFNFFEINGMKVTEPSQAFVLFWEFLVSQERGDVAQRRYSARDALNNLENHFNSPCPTRETCVLLVDELDQLVTKKQEVIYNFFNWPNQPHSRLIVIAVANKMDLPETELNGKIRSRLGSNRIQFKPYNHTQLMEILNMRLKDLTDTIFVKDAIQWVSKKISSLTGDVRKALDLCRSTLDQVDKENEIRRAKGKPIELVQVKDVIQTYGQMVSSGASKFVKQLSIHQSIMLLSISKAIKVAGIPEVEMGDVITRHLRFANSLGLKPEPTHEELMEVISSLQNMRMIMNESSALDYFSRIKLELKESDINLIIKNDKRFSNLAT